MQQQNQVWQWTSRWTPGVALGLWLGRVISEGWTAVSHQPMPIWGAMGLTLTTTIAGGWWLSRLSLKRSWPALLLIWYLFWPEMSGTWTAVSAGIALVTWTAVNCRNSHFPHLWGAVLTLIFFSLYALTLAPDLLPADNGEFQLVAARLGVAHPPGFPLYTLLAHGMTRLPGPGSAAVKVNLLSAISSSLTLWLVYLTTLRLTKRVMAAATAVIALGTATTFWAQATTANIRSLTALFAALMLYALIRFWQGNHARDQWLALFAAALGLGVTHHPSLLFMGALFVVFLVWHDPDLLRQPRRWGRPLLAAAAGLIPLIYLPLRAHSGAPGASPGVATWNGFWDHVLARGFSGDFFYFIEPGILAQRLKIMGQVMAFQFNGWLLAGMMGGLAILLWRERKLAFLLGGSFLLHAFITATYRAPQSVEYMMPAYIPAAILLGVGVGDRVMATKGRGWQGDRVMAVWGAVLLVAAVGQGWQRWPSFAQLSQSSDARDYAQPLLTAAPPDSLILADWHWATPLWYLQAVEGQRPDVMVEFVFPRGEPYGETWARRIDEELANDRPVIATHFNADDFASLLPSEPMGEAFYFRQTPRPAVPEDFRPLDLTLGSMVQVMGYRLSAPAVEIGQEVTLTLAWRPTAKLTEPISLFAHGVGADSRLYAQQDLPATPQPTGVTLTQFRLTVRQGAIPGDLAVMVGAYGRTPLLSADGAERTAVTTLTVRPMSQPPATQNPINRPIPGDSRRLVGYDWDNTLPNQPRLYLHWQTPDGFVTEVRDGVTTVTLPPTLGPWGLLIHNSQFTIHNSQFYIPLGQGIVWTGLTNAPLSLAASSPIFAPRFMSGRPILRDLVVSVRLVGYEADGFHWAWWDLDDSVPAMGAIPTLKWIGGTQVADPHRLDVPPTAVDGQEIGVLLGVYDAFTNRPLPILDERLTAVAPWVTMTRGRLEEARQAGWQEKTAVFRTQISEHGRWLILLLSD